MHANIRYRLVGLLAVLPLLLNAQPGRQRDPVALKHWAAPLYWQPARASSLEGASATPNASGPATPPSPLVFVAMSPCRIVDTRASSGFTGAYGPPSLVGNAVRTFPILSNTTCPLPATAQAYSFEITVVPPGPLAYITAFPTGESNPVAAIAVESPQGSMVSNTGIIPGGTNGSVDVYATNPTDLVMDVNGYYAAIGDANGNTTLGVGALANNVAPDTTAVGDNALNANTSGMWNTASGWNALSANTTGSENTASGWNALAANTTACCNTATGTAALQANTTGNGNTATGAAALQANTTGNSNTATGGGALAANTSGYRNTATGGGALEANTSGDYNTAEGFDALWNNTTGSSNTATGSFALSNNTTGVDNTAMGALALDYNTTGNNNTAQGNGALSGNTTGNGNTASGSGALFSNQTGNFNTATGGDALYSNSTSYYNTATGRNALLNAVGSNNTALGFSAGSNLTTGSNNIYIGSEGTSGDNNTIYLGTQGTQTTTYVAGIYGTNVGGSAVYVTSSGQLGVQSSSRRYKRDIRDMGDTTDVVMGLRPVRFRYKTEGAAAPEHYGLIAEEVAEVAPELVGRAADGQIDSVYYEKVNAMLLNEVQKQHRLIEEQQEKLQSQRAEFGERLQAQENLIQQLEIRLSELESHDK